ncbi:TadE/TadG family type IV pilus assembly protein [Caulobacter sp. KR2-114]|uniref:TadE/TadG family type IV pilus assembly protein n=1 Tax=Caulobacter sp. KR2-114 TaxID=3400912 RepID=UPI003C084A79
MTNAGQFRLLTTLRRFARAERGATAVEFSLIALPFFMLLFGILQLGTLFMASTTIESATVTAARQIRTGQIQNGGTNTAAGFKSLVCNNMSWLSSADCTNNLSVDVRTFGSFGTITNTPPVKNGAIDQTQLQFNAGTNCSIVLVRVYYPFTLVAPAFTPGLPDLGSNQKLITFASAFRNENWGNTGNCGAP